MLSPPAATTTLSPLPTPAIDMATGGHARTVVQEQDAVEAREELVFGLVDGEQHRHTARRRHLGQHVHKDLCVCVGVDWFVWNGEEGWRLVAL
jgi:hypothetical protein